MDRNFARGRIAPSPTGRMHLGNAFAFLMAFCSVKNKKGSLVLRIEDIDPDRSRLEFEQSIIEDLAWLGISYDEGPLLYGKYAPYKQSERKSLYESALRELERKDLIYPCFCTRKELKLLASAPHNEDGSVQYPGTCRHLSERERKSLRESGKKACIRLDVEKAIALYASSPIKNSFFKQKVSDSLMYKRASNLTIKKKEFDTKGHAIGDTDASSLDNVDTINFFDSRTLRSELLSFRSKKYFSAKRTFTDNSDVFEEDYFFSKISPVYCDDFALMRSDGVIAYQLAVVVDDIAMNITEVVRGDDLEDSTPRQKLLYYLLGASPPSFYHFPLLCDHNGERLAKRHNSLTLTSLREQGVKPEAVIGYLGFIAGLIDANIPMTPMQLVKHWNKDKVKRGAIVLPQDPVKAFYS